MIENKFDVFLSKASKSEALEADSTKKPNYFSQLFSKSLWFPKLREFPLSSNSTVVKRPNSASKPKITDMLSTETLKNVGAQKAETKAEVITKAKTQEVKSNESNDTTEKKKISLTPKPKEGSVGFGGKSDSSFTDREFLVNTDFDSFLGTVSQDWDSSQVTGIDSFNESVDVLFLGLDEFEPKDLPEVVPMSLIESEQDLLGKMIKAMNLKSGQFIRYPLLKGDMDMEFVLAGILKFKPRVVVPLGATATNLVLQKKVKLSNVHGVLTKKGYTVNGEEMMVNISPLFHPQLLEINQSMKRTAWLDMKAVMAFLEA